MRRVALVVLCWWMSLMSGCGDDTQDGSVDAGLDESVADLTDVVEEPNGGDDVGMEDPILDIIDAIEDSPGDLIEEVDGDEPSAEDPVEEEIVEIPTGPPEILFTVDELPDYLNGTLPYMDHGDGPFDFTLTLPTSGFTFDLFADRPPDYLDEESFEVFCSQPIGTSPGVPAETDLSDSFEWGPDRIRWVVAEAYAFVESPVTCRARVANLDGDLSGWSEVTFDTMEQTADYHPFEPPDTWVITFSRDLHDVQFEVTGAGEFIVTSQRTPDGEPDFLEDLRIGGLQGDESGAGAATVEARGVQGVNAIMAEWIISETMKQLRSIYEVDPDTGAPHTVDSIGITIYREGDPGAPDQASWDETFSIHGVGGDSPPDSPTLFGRATAIDYNNRTSQNDSVLGFGTFSTNLVRTVVTNPAGRFLMREFLVGYGVPIGNSSMDAEILSDDFDYHSADYATRRRCDQLNLVVDLLVTGLSSLIAHEMGHSLGLVAPGPPPTGLFGGVYDPSWMASESNSTHIDTFGLNVMQTGASLMVDPTGILDGEVVFYPLNLAYLRGRVIVLR